MIPYAENYEKANQANGPPTSFYEQENRLKWYNSILVNRPFRVISTIVLVSIITPLLLYAFIMSSTLDLSPSDGYSQGSCILPRKSRLPCGKGYITQQECHPQCCYDLVNNFCFHRLPSRFSYIMDRPWTEDLYLHPRVATEPFANQQSLINIRLSIDEISRSHLTITFYNSREITPDTARRLSEKDYDYRVSSPELNVEVTAGGKSIFSTRRGPLIAANNIWETSFQLTNETMFGFGEIPLTNSTKTIYNTRGGLASIPLIYAKINDTFHGLLIDVETPTEMFIAGDNQIVVRSITSSHLKFHLFLGPKPKDVMNNVMKFVGFEQSLEYWMLGAHVCSETANTLQGSYNNLVEFINEARSAGLPYESHCGSSPLVMNQGCDEDAEEVGNAADLLLNEGKKHIPHLSPYIRYVEQKTNDSEEIINNRSSQCSFKEFEHLLMKSNGTLYLGLAGKNIIVYPNYDKSSSKELIERFWNHDSLDGVVLENSWPLDESLNWNNETHLYLPYFNMEFEESFRETPQWNATIGNALYMNQHNKYGESFYEAIKDLFDKPIWTTSQWMNGRAMINRQHVDTSWSNLRRQMVEAALGGISGHWLWSSPICGDTDSFDNITQTNLCIKWYMAGTYFPMIRIHSKGIPRDPMAFDGTNKQHILQSLTTRQMLLPYFFTVLQHGPLLRPMFFQYPESANLANITTQFNVGECLLIVPNLQPSQTIVNVWLPPGKWFELWSGLNLGENGEVVALTTTNADFVTLIRGGSIVVMQKNVRPSAEETRRTSDYSMTIALDCNQSQSTCAFGELYINQNMTINFNATNQQLTITSEGDDFGPICREAISASTIKHINIYGLDGVYNNFDHHRYVESSIDLCELKTVDQIVYSFL